MAGLLDFFSNNPHVVPPPDQLQALVAAARAEPAETSKTLPEKQPRDCGGSHPASSPAPVPSPQWPHRLVDRLEPQQIQALIRQYRSGQSASAVARQAGVSTSALLTLLRKHGVAVRRPGISDTLARALAQAHQAGATLRQLEQQYGLSHGVVWRAVHRSFRQP